GELVGARIDRAERPLARAEAQRDRLGARRGAGLHEARQAGGGFARGGSRRGMRSFRLGLDVEGFAHSPESASLACRLFTGSSILMQRAGKAAPHGPVAMDGRRPNSIPAPGFIMRDRDARPARPTPAVRTSSDEKRQRPETRTATPRARAAGRAATDAA